MNKAQTTRNIGILCIFFFSLATFSAVSAKGMTVDKVHVNNWNAFFSNVYAFHLYQLSQHDVYTKESTGGYAGNPTFYREVEYYSEDTDQLLSRIQWETENPQQIHVIETYIYDESKTLKSDYLVAFLPEYRNAPVQTLINIHYHDHEFDSYRQFDASGYRIYEECKGTVFGDPVFISLMDDDFNSIEQSIVKTMSSEAYLSCFEHLPTLVGNDINPASGLTLSEEIVTKAGVSQPVSTQDDLQNVYQKIILLSKKIKANEDAGAGSLYVDRGKAYFKTHQFSLATADYTAALKLDDTLDEAYFGRGMSLGREGKMAQSITDLNIYIQRNPVSSVALTKRGVRHIWAGNYELAEKDLKQAIALDPGNAEAHDDLGVLYARKGSYQDSIYHFKQVIKHDSSYAKGFHNLAMVYHLVGQNKRALKAINGALYLSKNEKNSLLLKGEILIKLEMHKEAQSVIQQAEFLPEGNWSERFAIRP